MQQIVQISFVTQHTTAQSTRTLNIQIAYVEAKKKKKKININAGKTIQTYDNNVLDEHSCRCVTEHDAHISISFSALHFKGCSMVAPCCLQCDFEIFGTIFFSDKSTHPGSNNNLLIK